MNTELFVADDAAYRGLTMPGSAAVTGTATSRRDSSEIVTMANLTNPTTVAALATKRTLFDAVVRQILPAYVSDNYVSLLPGKTRRIAVRPPVAAACVALRRWNVMPLSIAVPPSE